MLPAFWTPLLGRELDATPLPDTRGQRVVACLNVWNDADALRHSVPSWIHSVDHVIAVDGSYGTLGCTISTDGTREYLTNTCPSIQWIDRPGVDQCAKRNAYLQAGRVGDYLFIVDADESVQSAEALRRLPMCDIGWVRILSPMYARPYGQPRVLRWRPDLEYRGRHHWIYDGDRLFCTHQYGGPGYAHRPVNLTLSNERNAHRSASRLQVKSTHLAQQTATERVESATPRTIMSDSQIGARECLWILNYAYRDDGLAPSRFHTAINRTTPHSSLFFKARPGPFSVPQQFMAKPDHDKLRQAADSCDILHLHSTTVFPAPLTRRAPMVFHHHGSLLRANADAHTKDAMRHRALVLVSNLELLSWTGDHPAFFLPNTMPVARYRALAERVADTQSAADRPFRIAHSPTHQHRKGTEVFLRAMTNCAKRGLHVEPVLIENQTHAATLALKATCDAAFDSFWLGIQCSGLEVAAMGKPVIAGDPIVAERYRAYFGAVPYTYANTLEELEAVITRLVTDEHFLAEEADRVNAYVIAHHGEAAVALTYLDYLDMAYQWRKTPRRKTVVSAQPLHTFKRVMR
jgi:hypothetical protein